ncbi:DMT family transporter [Methylobacterium planeticum]|uniref:DMT family transporter n=1 Tax=Methylobacterium planeticum TaxID=2615211 RepID=A0A6N6MUT9_9HYPH|nr:DMT family transporter [Methylobacterium planeticum]KAB1072617.1 DMT family transporter [Methylobacterium planeticum]
MWYFYGFVLLAGIANAIQPGMNGALAKNLPQPLVAGLVVGAGTVLSILTVGLISGRLSLPSYEQATQIPWWAWFGGVLGGGIVITQLLIARQIGAAPFLGVLVTAGVATSIALDHFGWVGFEQHPATLWRILGGLLMIVGVAVVAMT